jgi:hypothetical protein
MRLSPCAEETAADYVTAVDIGAARGSSPGGIVLAQRCVHKDTTIMLDRVCADRNAIDCAVCC